MHRRSAPCLNELRSIALGKLKWRNPQELAVLRRHRSKQKLDRNDAEDTTLEAYTLRLIDGAAKAEKWPGWSHPETRFGEEKRIYGSLDPAQNPRMVPTMAKLRYYAGGGKDIADAVELETETEGEVIPPGTFVEIRRNEVVTNGVVLCEKYHDSRPVYCTITTTGELFNHKEQDVMFNIKNFVSHTLVQSCGESITPESHSQLNARADVLKRIRDFELKMELATAHAGLHANLLHSKFKSPDPDQWAQLTTTQVAQELVPSKASMPVTHLFAAHKIIMARPTQFVPGSTNFRNTHLFDVLPQTLVDEIEGVTRMVRMKRDLSPLPGFAEKARKLVQSSRERALNTWNDEPSAKMLEDVQFTTDEQRIINFLRHSIRWKRTTQSDPYSVPASTIIKEVGLYDVLIDQDVVFQFLIDMGVFAPWQDPASRNRELGLSQDPAELERKAKRDEEITKKAMETRASVESSRKGDPSAVQTQRPGKMVKNHYVPLIPPTWHARGPEDFYSYDPLEAVRHDFGNMPVYVVDDYGAQELDDGISYEPDPSDPNCIWAHVHIADPTAFLSPSHVFSKAARNQMQTAYFIHQTWPMLPSSLMYAGLSLGSRSPQEVLTFSMKVDKEGDIVDYKVRAGLIRNVRVVRYDDVDRALGLPTAKLSYPFGGGQSSESTEQPIPEEYIPDLKNLGAIAQRLVDHTLKLPVFLYGFAPCNISYAPKPPIPSPGDVSHPAQFSGFPRLTYGVGSFDNMAAGARGYVAEFMKGACRVASRFCLERGIPVLRRSSPQLLTQSDEDFLQILETRNQYGTVDAYTALKLGAMSPAATYTLEPGEHWALGIPQGEGYTRVTSPLRRYSDMVAHWQIKHALSPRDFPLLFSTDELKQLGQEFLEKEKLARRASRLHTQYWAGMYIKRWLEDPSWRGKDVAERDPNPLDSLTARVTSLPTKDTMEVSIDYKVYLPALGFRADLVTDRVGADALPIGATLKVQLDTIELGLSSRIMVKLRE